MLTSHSHIQQIILSTCYVKDTVLGTCKPDKHLCLWEVTKGSEKTCKLLTIQHFILSRCCRKKKRNQDSKGDECVDKSGRRWGGKISILNRKINVGFIVKWASCI